MIFNYHDYFMIIFFDVDISVYENGQYMVIIYLNIVSHLGNTIKPRRFSFPRKSSRNNI